MVFRIQYREFGPSQEIQMTHLYSSSGKGCRGLKKFARKAEKEIDVNID